MVSKRDHDFVPIHQLLSEKEVNTVLEKLNLRKENLPKLFAEDPQVKKLGAKPGQIVRVYRNDNSHEYEYYRLVTEA